MKQLIIFILCLVSISSFAQGTKIDSGQILRLPIAKLVTPTTPTNGQVIKYNSTSGKWEPGTDSGGSVTPDTTYILVAGQSNAWGATGPTSVDTTQNSKVQVWNHVGGVNVWRKAVINKRPFRTSGYNALDGGASRDDLNGSVPASFHLAKKIQEETGNIVRLVFAVGDGQPISTWFTTTKQRFLDTALTRSVSAGVTKYDIMVWAQGESDGATAEATYNARFDSILATLRRQTYFPVTTPVIVSGLAQTSQGATISSFTTKDTTFQKYDYANDQWVGYARVDGLPDVWDGIHWSGAGVKLLGRERYWTAISTLPRRSVERGKNLTGSGGSSNFLALSDSPDSYTGQANKVIRVNSAQTALEFGAIKDKADTTILANSIASPKFKTTDVSGFRGIWLGNKTPSLTNYDLLNIGDTTIRFNAVKQLELHIANNPKLTIRGTSFVSNAANAVFGDIGIQTGYRMAIDGQTYSVNNTDGASNLALRGTVSGTAYPMFQQMSVGGSMDNILWNTGAGINRLLMYSSGSAGDNLVGFWHIPGGDAGKYTIGVNSTNDKFQISTGLGISSTPEFNLIPGGQIGILTTSPTARLHIGAGTAAANTAPLKFTSGTNLTTPEAGAVEYDGTEFYATNSGASRTILARVLKGSATLDFPDTASGSSSSLTITVTGAATTDSGVSVQRDNASIAGTMYEWVITGANTVTAYFHNFSGSNQNPASGAFRATVIK